MVISIFFAKLSMLILRIFNKGATSLPGKIALLFKKDILKELSKGVKIICVTGTNGKTTTCALLAYAMRENKTSYFINNGGANMISGVVSAFIKNSNLFGKCKKEYAILECDENSFPEISKYIEPKAIAVTNLFRDQLDRYGEVQHTMKQIVKAIHNCPKAYIILNADCPLSSYIARLCSNQVYTFGLKTKRKYDVISDVKYCPVCSSELKYKSRIYAQLGDFYCPVCSYKREMPDCEISEISNDGKYHFKLTLDGKENAFSMGLTGIYNCYNFACAALLLHKLENQKIEYLSGFSGAFGRYEKFSNNGKTVLLLLVKNPVGMQSCINLISEVKGSPSLAFALNDNAADGHDISWIWDCDFSSLEGDKIYTLGTRSYDMALRLKYDNLCVTKALEKENCTELVSLIKNSKNDFVIFANYTSMMHLRRYLISEFGGNAFWKEEK